MEKEDIINGKEEMNAHTHPYFSQLDKSRTTHKEELKISPDENIIVFSPHPDDEILGACKLLHTCFENKINVKVIYMTSGKTAGKSNIRQKEAISGISKLGGLEEQLIFTNMPFYDRKNREVKDDDYEFVTQYLRKYNPTSIFVCSDVFDPNGTHGKCFDILMETMKMEEFKDINIYLYYSVWYWPNENEYNLYLPYDFQTYKMKIYAMLEHQSQLETNFMGNDPRPFYQRACARDRAFGKKFNHAYCEIYYKL